MSCDVSSVVLSSRGASGAAMSAHGSSMLFEVDGGAQASDEGDSIIRQALDIGAGTGLAAVAACSSL